MKRYRITPEEFRAQLTYSKENEYYTITFEDWYLRIKSNMPIPGRAFILNFDDGYIGFYDYAFPLLAEFNFSTYVLLDYIGRGNIWDAKVGEEIPLMSASQITDLYRRGIKFGSHSASQRPSTALTPDHLEFEFSDSLAKFRNDFLGLDLSSIADPYGDYDSVVKHSAGACGFTFGLTCDEGKCNKFSELLSLPRIEISGYDALNHSPGNSISSLFILYKSLMNSFNEITFLGN